MFTTYILLALNNAFLVDELSIDPCIIEFMKSAQLRFGFCLEPAMLYV